MEEQHKERGEGLNSDQATGTAAKLPLENTTTNTANEIGHTDAHTDTDNKQDQTQGTLATDTLEFVAVEGFQVGRGVARIDPSDIARLGCQPGDIVLITGARTTAAKIVPSALADRDQLTIQMDSQVRQNSASGLGERVIVRKAKASPAEKITLLPLSSEAPIQESDLQYIARYLIGLPVTVGDLLRVGTPGTAPRAFLIINTKPAHPSYALRRTNTRNLPIIPPEPGNELGADCVHAVTIVRAQIRGAANGMPARLGYEDIGGLGKELQRIREMIELPLKYPAVFDRLGV